MKTKIISCLVASLFLQPQQSPAQKRSEIVISHLEVNSSEDDFAPYLSSDGRTLFFSSKRESQQLSGIKQKIFSAERSGASWKNAKPLERSINASTQNAVVAFTPDAQYMIFGAYEHPAGTAGRFDLYSSKKINGKWTEVKNLGDEVNSDAWDSQPSLSSDGNTLYFVSDRSAGEGGADIYYSKRIDGKWTEAVNAGSAINSKYDDMSPIIGADNKTLYFASNREGGMGGFDIYTAKRSEENFSEPKNIGSPINSANNEYFYFAVANSTTAYFSSDRPGGSGKLDLYKADPNPVPSDPVCLVHGVVSDAANKKVLGSDILITDLKTQKTVASFRSDDESGEYFVTLTAGRRYSITATRNGYVFYSDHYELPTIGERCERIKNIDLSPLAEGKTRLLIFFDYDKAELKDESRPELDRLVTLMKENTSMNIVLEGHTDDQGTDDYNDKLSGRRADAAKEYLVHASISEDRIRTKGLGKKQPLIKSTTDEARAQNRRVEMKIIK